MRWGIALEGGGVRCAAQAGAVIALLEAGLEPCAFAGCGAGAWVAALCACQKTPKELWRDTLSLSHSGLFGPRGLKSRRIAQLLKAQTGSWALNETPCGFIAPAVDLESGAVHVFSSILPYQFDPRPWSRQISFPQAILASLAAPGVLPPVSWRGHRLSGGGMLRPLLPQLLRAIGMERVVVIRVLSEGCARTEKNPAALAICSHALIPASPCDGDFLLEIGDYGQGLGVLDSKAIPQLLQQGYLAAHRELSQLRMITRMRRDNILLFPRADH